MKLLRRQFIKIAGGAAIASTLRPAPVQAAARPDFGVSVFPFPLSQVTLLDGPFRANMGRTTSYLSFVDADGCCTRSGSTWAWPRRRRAIKVMLRP